MKLTETGYLPESNSKRPNIGGGRELSVSDRLDGHPPDWQSAQLTLHVHQPLLLLRDAVQAKVSNLDHFVGREEEIATCHVTVDNPNGGQMFLGVYKIERERERGGGGGGGEERESAVKRKFSTGVLNRQTVTESGLSFSKII